MLPRVLATEINDAHSPKHNKSALAVYLFQHLFKSPEIKVVLAAFQNEAKRIRSDDSSVFGARLGLDFLEVKIENCILESNDVIKNRFRVENESPRTLMLLLLSNLSRQYVTSGHYHTYRGLLSMTGTGLLGLWNYATGELEKSGVITKEDSDFAKIRIAEEIKEVGS